MLSLTVEWLSMRGGREYNEDACGHWRSAHHFCAVLADGAGHHGGGDVASKMAVRELVGRFSQQPSEGADNLRALVRDVNDVIIAGKTPGTVKHDMHTTVVCLALDLVEKRVVSFEEGEALAKEFKTSFMEVSAWSGQNVNESFLALALMAKERLDNGANESEGGRTRAGSLLGGSSLGANGIKLDGSGPEKPKRKCC
jgi:hypothetical protein